MYYGFSTIAHDEIIKTVIQEFGTIRVFDEEQTKKHVKCYEDAWITLFFPEGTDRYLKRMEFSPGTTTMLLSFPLEVYFQNELVFPLIRIFALQYEYLHCEFYRFNRQVSFTRLK